MPNAATPFESRDRGEDIKYLVEERMEGIGVHCTVVSTCVEMQSR